MVKYITHSLFLALTLSAIFYDQLLAYAPFVHFVGIEWACELVMLIGITFMAIQEAGIDYYLESNGMDVDHNWSSYQRVVLTGLSMILLGYPSYMGLDYFVLNLAFFLYSYSLIFNLRLNYMRGKYFIDHIRKNATSLYDRIWYKIAFNNGALAGWLKTVSETSSLVLLIILKHFV